MRQLGLYSRDGKPENLTPKYWPGRNASGVSSSITTSSTSGDSVDISARMPARLVVTGTSSNTISASPSIVARHASTVLPSTVPWWSTAPRTTVTRQASHWPEQQSCGTTTQPPRPASTSVSPICALTDRPLMRRLQALRMVVIGALVNGSGRGGLSIVHDDADRARMAGVTGLGMIEHGDPHVEIAADHEVLVVLAPGHGVAARDERPMAIAPVCRAAHVGAVAAVLAYDEDARDDGADRDRGVELGRIRNGLVFEHPPLRAVVDARVRIRIPTAHRLVRRDVVLGQAADRHGATVILVGPQRHEVVNVIGVARVAPVAALISSYLRRLLRRRFGR